MCGEKSQTLWAQLVRLTLIPLEKNFTFLYNLCEQWSSWVNPRFSSLLISLKAPNKAEKCCRIFFSSLLICVSLQRREIIQLCSNGTKTLMNGTAEWASTTAMLEFPLNAYILSGKTLNKRFFDNDVSSSMLPVGKVTDDDLPQHTNSFYMRHNLIMIWNSWDLNRMMLEVTWLWFDDCIVTLNMFYLINSRQSELSEVDFSTRYFRVCPLNPRVDVSTRVMKRSWKTTNFTLLLKTF